MMFFMKSWTYQRYLSFVILVGVSFVGVSPARADETTIDAKSSSATVVKETSEHAGSDAVDDWMHSNGAKAENSAYLLRRSNQKKEGNVSVPAKREKLSSAAMMWPLLAVLGTIGLIAFGAKKWMPRATRVGGGTAVKILARQYLAGKHSVCLVRLGQRVLLLGVSPERVTTLTEIVDPAETSALLSDVEQGRPQSFTASLGQFMHAEASEAEGEELEEQTAEMNVQESSRRELLQTGENVRGLVDRIRALSLGASATTESVSRRSLTSPRR